MRPLLALALMMLAAPAAAQEAALTARVEGRAVIHPGAPALRISVPATATYAGGERFTLYGVADCEIHVFVEADAERRIRRFYWIQFEGYLPSRPELRYNYAEGGNARRELWGTTTWVRAGFGSTSRPARAGSDTERVRTILQRAGYVAPANLLNVRMVQMLDDPQGTGQGRRELMLIYAEDMAPTGTTPEQLLVDGAPGPAWAPIEQPLIARAAAAFTVERR